MHPSDALIALTKKLTGGAELLMSFRYRQLRLREHVVAPSG
jgi:hypothetical protein